MKALFLLLTKPSILLLLWFSLVLALWQLLTPIQTMINITLPFELPEQSILLTMVILLGVLSSLSIISPMQSHRLQRELKQQALYYKQLIKDLKHQHQEEDQQIQALMQNEQFAYWEWNIKTNQANFSAQWKKMIGLSKNDLLNNLHDLQQRVHPKDQQAVQQGFLKILSGEQKLFECTHRIQHEDGHYVWVHDKGQVFHDADGEIEKICAIRLDVSEQKWIEDELEVDATVIEHASEGIAITDENMKVVRCNHALCQTLEKATGNQDTTDLNTLLNSLQTQTDTAILETLDQEGFWKGQLNLLDENGELKLASRISLKKIFHDTTQSLHYSFIHSDITDLKRIETALNDLANIDSVTGLANRNKLYQNLKNDLLPNRDITLMFLDLDYFKKVNDTLGHDIGDLLLRSVGKEIQKLIPENALLARVGGDEFVLYYEQSLSNLSATDIAQRITERLNQPFRIHHHEIKIGSSIGIAHYPEQAADRQSLMKAADTAMYHAKHAGKGQYCEFSEQLKADQQVA
ncbi:MAG: diguanylate cyclase [Pseudomonadota bacterium]|nr:diguanylate cyclase [Pseudomonadota bacterium]